MPDIEIHGSIKNLSSSPDIAFQYQPDGTPWDSVLAAHNGTPADFIAIGKIRYVDSGDGIRELWYQGGKTAAHLVPKVTNTDIIYNDTYEF